MMRTTTGEHEAIPFPVVSYTLHPLKVLRGRHNLTQQMLADFTQLSLSTIERAERGLPLQVYARQQLCAYFGKSVEELGLAICYPKTRTRRDV